MKAKEEEDFDWHRKIMNQFFEAVCRANPDSVFYQFDDATFIQIR